MNITLLSKEDFAENLSVAKINQYVEITHGDFLECVSNGSLSHIPYLLHTYRSTTVNKVYETVISIPSMLVMRRIQ